MDLYINDKIINLDKDKLICWYACGPTVYDQSHMGHARTYIMIDVVRRILQYHGYTIILGMNITDIDDKILKRSNELGISAKSLTDKYEAQFWDSLDKLGVSKPDIILRATENINSMIEMITILIEKGYAYQSHGSVYMDTKKCVLKYGQPFGLKVDHDEAWDNKFVDEKRHSSDFVLWKRSKEGETLKWDSPWSEGRPGWHIECSAMANKMFGKQFDIHSGGIDLKFPHHTNEIIQSMAYNDDGNKWVQNFIHTGHLTIDNEKMSKSEKNFVSIDDVLASYDSNTIRLAFLMFNLTKPMNWADDLMVYVNSIMLKFKNSIKTVDNIFYDKTINRLLSDEDKTVLDKLNEYKQSISLDLFNLGKIPNIIKSLEKAVDLFNIYNREAHPSIALFIKQLLIDTLSIFGIKFTEKIDKTGDKYLDIIFQIRDDARSNKMYKLSDKIRDVYLKDLGIEDK